MSNVFACTARAFQFYADGTEAGAAALAAENAALGCRATSNVQLVLRYGIQESGAGSISGATTDDYQLQVSKNGGAYASVTTTSSNVKAWASANLTDAGTTTQRLTAGTGAFVAGEISETGLVTDRQLTANNFTEMLYTIEIVAADVADGDRLDFRVLLNGAVFASYTVTPRIVTVKVADPDATSNAKIPVTLGEWTTLLTGTGLSNPIAAWNFQDSASFISPVVGLAKDALGVGTLSYRQTATGWTRKGVTTTNNSANGVSGSSLPTDMVTKSCMMLLVTQLGGPDPAGGAFGLMHLGASAQASVAVIGSGTKNLRVYHRFGTTVSVDGTVDYTGTNVLVTVLQYNLTASQITLHTSQEVLKPTWSGTGAGGGNIAFYAISGFLNAPGGTPLMYAALWDGAAAEMSDADVQTLIGKVSNTVITTLAATTANVPITGTAATPKYNHALAATTANVPISGTAATVQYIKRLTATAGSVPITGTAATLKEQHLVSASSGNVPIGGTAAALKVGHLLAATTANVPISGTAAALKDNRLVSAASGNVPITGSAVSLKELHRIAATTANVPINGTAASLVYTKRLTASPGSVPISGTAATLTYNAVTSTTLTATTGNVPITGSAASLKTNHRVAASSGSVPISGSAATPRVDHRLAATTANVPITGSAALVGKAFRLTAASANLPITGSAASLKESHRLTAASGSVPISGTAMAPKVGHRLAATTANVPISGSAAALANGIRLAAASGSVPISGSVATLIRQRVLSALSNNVPISGSVAAAVRRITLAASSANVPISGSAATLTRARALSASFANVPITGQTASFVRSRVLAALSGNVPISGSAASLEYTGAFAPVDWELLVARLATAEVEVVVLDEVNVMLVTSEPTVKCVTEAQHQLAPDNIAVYLVTTEHVARLVTPEHDASIAGEVTVQSLPRGVVQ